jgi:hypothetical protein
MRTRLLVAPVTVTAVVAGTVLMSGAAAGAARAPSTVTIDAEGTDLFGTVSSPKPAKCAAGRKVIVFKQVGSRGGGDDEKFASDSAEKQGDSYVWSTGNTGTQGRFYAKVRRTAHCKADSSPTIKVTTSA